MAIAVQLKFRSCWINWDFHYNCFSHVEWWYPTHGLVVQNRSHHWLASCQDYETLQKILNHWYYWPKSFWNCHFTLQLILAITIKTWVKPIEIEFSKHCYLDQCCVTTNSLSDSRDFKQRERGRWRVLQNPQKDWGLKQLSSRYKTSLMMYLKEVRNQLLISHDGGVIKDEELLLLYGLNRFDNVDLPSILILVLTSMIWKTASAFQSFTSTRTNYHFWLKCFFHAFF